MFVPPLGPEGVAVVVVVLGDLREFVIVQSVKGLDDSRRLHH